MAYTGTVKSFNPHKGWGFIECPALGTDAFVIKSELNGFAVKKGDQVSFNATDGTKGKQATDIKVTSSADGSQSFFGEVKTWNDMKGFGFLNSSATDQVFGKDVFALRSEFKDGMVFQGAQVIFKASVGELGPVASEVQVLNGGSGFQSFGGGAWTASAWSPAAAWATGWGAGAMGSWGKGGPQGWGKTPSEREVYFGSLKAINEEKGWGHIACEAMQKLYGKDIFVMKTGLENIAAAPGQMLSFNVAQGPKGPHAINLKPFDNQAAGMVFSGQVKSYNETKGWGFIESPQSQEIFNTDIFVHQRGLTDGQLATGTKVQFTVDITGGRASAKDVKVC